MKNRVALLVIFGTQLIAQPLSDENYTRPTTDIQLSPEYIGTLSEFENTEQAEYEFREINAVFNRYEQIYGKPEYPYYDEIIIDSLAKEMGCTIPYSSPLWYSSEMSYSRPSSAYWRHRGAHCGGPEAWVRNYSTTSTYPNSSRNTYDASNLEDWDLSTAWVEGRDDYGLGERINFSFFCQDYRDDGVVERTFEIYNGYTKSENSWRNNSRVKTLILGRGDSAIATLHLEDIREPQSFNITLPSTYDSTELYFEIADYYAGDKWSDVAITEIVAADGGCCFAAGTEISLVDGSTRAIESIAKGDLVKTLDSEGRRVIAEVLSTVEIEHNNCYIISFSGSELTITDDHPLLTVHGQWATVRGGYSSYVHGETVQLAIGDRIQTESGMVIVKEITVVDEVVQTYAIKELSVGTVVFANGIAAAVENK